jgi:hypothetical protein
MNLIKNLKGCRASEEDIEMYLKQFEDKRYMTLEQEGCYAVIKRIGNGKIELFIWSGCISQTRTIKETDLKNLKCLFKNQPRAYYSI